MLFIKDAYLAMQTMQELNRNDCVEKVKLRIGKALTTPERFKRVFERFSEGTFFENIDVDIEEVPVELSCGCGYSRRVSDGHAHRYHCPRCGSRMFYSRGNEFEILDQN